MIDLLAMEKMYTCTKFISCGKKVPDCKGLMTLLMSPLWSDAIYLAR